MHRYPPAIVRLRQRLQPQGDCLLYTGYILPAGYGQLSENGKLRLAHQIAYEAAKGEVPKGLEIMHTCNNRACCNPDHLIAGTHAQNMEMSRRDACLKGHPRTQENTYLWRGVRYCIPCREAYLECKKQAALEEA